jgi:TRAP-type C4-dicarboxylate transport system permease small subunit
VRNENIEIYLIHIISVLRNLKPLTMKSLTRIFTGIVMLVFFSVGATAQISGTSDPFIFDTTSTAVPISGIAMGVVVVLILGFITRRHVLSGKKAGI